MGMCNRVGISIISAGAIALAGCQVTKSANPLTPTVAGPIAGVAITPPGALSPSDNSRIYARDQPIKLLIANSESSGQRPVTYVFEIAGDAGFSNVVFKRSGVQPGPDGKTTLQLPDALATGRTYWWRAQAEDGANASDYSNVATFSAMAPVVIAPPIPDFPTGAVSTLVPVFKVTAGSADGPVEKIRYTIQVSGNQAFTSIVATFDADQVLPQTSIAQTNHFLNTQTYYWRVQSRDMGDSQAVSPWSAVQIFTTPVAGAPSGGGGGAGGGACGPPYPSGGQAIVDCVAAKYPQYLVANVSLSQRLSNMQFIRDRVIETGKCGGLDLGRNAKRGNPNDISNDFIVQMVGGVQHGIDIASAYDDTSQPLHLHWLEYGPPDYGFPSYLTYGAVSCN